MSLRNHGFWMKSSVNRGMLFLCLFLGIILFLLVISTFAFASDDIMEKPLVSFQVEWQAGPPLRIEAGQDFWADLSVQTTDHTGTSVPGMTNMAAFQGYVVFDPSQLEVLGVEPGEMIPVTGWTLQTERETAMADRVRVTLRGPQNALTGLNGYGQIIRVRFRALEGAGGPGIFALDGGNLLTYPDGSEHPPFTWGGYFTDINDQVIPVRTDVPPYLGISSFVEIIPSQTRITAANIQRQSLRLSLDASVNPQVISQTEKFIVSLSTDGGASWTLLKPDINSPMVRVSPRDFVITLEPGPGFTAGDSLKLRFAAIAQNMQTGETTTLIGPLETPEFTVPQTLGGPLDIGNAVNNFTIGARISYQGQELSAYNAVNPPTLEGWTSPGGPVAWDVFLFALDGRLVKQRGFSPGNPLPQELDIDPTWNSGDYRLVVAAKYLFDYSGTTVSYTALPVSIQWPQMGLEIAGKKENENFRLPAGGEFQVRLNTEHVVNLASFLGVMAYDPGQLELLEVRKGSILPEEGWVPQANSLEPGRVQLILQAPPGQTLNASGDLLTLVFRSMPESGGRTVFSLQGGTHESDSGQDGFGPYHWTGYLKDGNGNDIPIKEGWGAAGPPFLGFTRLVEITPLEIMITGSNPQFQSLILSFSQPVISEKVNYELSVNGGEFVRLTRDGGSSVIYDPLHPRIIVGNGIDFSAGDRLQLRLTGLIDQDGTELSSQPQITPVHIAREPHGYFVIENAYLAFGGDTGWPVYDVLHPPTLHANVTDMADAGPRPKWVRVYGPQGALLQETFISPGYRLPQTINLPTAWPTGNYTLELLASYDWDFTGTSVVHTTLSLPVQQFSGSVSGRVTDRQNQPIAGAEVTAVSLNDPKRIQVTVKSNSSGEYAIPGLPPEKYMIVAKAADYARTVYNGTPGGTYSDKTALPVIVTDSSVIGLNFTLTPGGNISGTIYGENGTPLPYTHVRAELATDQGAGNGAITDRNGRYTIYNLPFGSYKIYAEPAQWEPGSNLSYLRGYYRNSARWEEADVITLSAETSSISGIDFSLEPGGSISGRITDGAGNGLSSSVWADLNVGTDKWVNVSNTKTDENGYYVIRGLAGGEYKVGARAAGMVQKFYPDTMDWGKAQVLVVTASDDTPNINFSLEPGGSISGKITDAQGSPLAGVSVEANNTDGSSGMGTQTGYDGSFSLEGLPYGSYKLSAPGGGRWGPNDDNWMRQWYSQIVKIDTAAPKASGITINLEQGGSITGYVYDADGQTPLSQLHVFAENYLTGEWIADTWTRDNGSYEITGLPAGAYRVQARPSQGGQNYINTWYSDAGGTYKRDQAQPVNVTVPEATSGINFILPPAGSISGIVVDAATGATPRDATVGSIELAPGWHKLVYRFEEIWGASEARAAFKAPGDPDWRRFSTSELEIRTSPDHEAQAGITLTTKKNNWDHPGDHGWLVAAVDLLATEETGWSGQSIVQAIDQHENIHGHDDDFTSYYESYFYVPEDQGGVWHFSTDSDDASEIVVDDRVVAYWYDGHGSAKRWEYKGRIYADRILGYIDQSGKQVPQWGEHFETFINPDGSYKINSLPPGEYFVSTSVPGYVKEQVASIEVTTGAATTGINFNLERGGGISGRITDTGGNPAMWVTVAVFRNDGQLIGLTLTDSNGDYSITGVLPSGDYGVGAGNAGYVPTLYPGVVSPEEAHLIAVNAPQTVDGIDIALPRLPEFTVTPAVLERGQLPAAVTLDLNGVVDYSRHPVIYYAVLDNFASSRDAHAVGQAIDTGEPGVYRVAIPAGLHPGSYSIAILDQLPGGPVWGPTSFAFGTFSVVEEGAPDSGGSISGSIEYKGSNTGSGVILVSASTESTGQPVIRTLIEINGPDNYVFQFSQLPAGKYTVRAFLLTAEGQEKLNMFHPILPGELIAFGYYPKPVLVESGKHVQGVDLSLNMDGSTIHGTINYQGTAEGDVYLAVGLRTFPGFPAYPPLFSPIQAQVGPFEVTPVPGGSYYLIAFIDQNGNRLPDPGEPQGLVPRFNEENISVPDNEDVKVNVTIYDPTSLTGTVSYQGNLGDPESYSVGVYALKLLSGESLAEFIAGPGPYYISPVPTFDYLIAALLDLNGNGKGDLGEPVGFYGNLTPVSVGGEPITGINIAMDDTPKGLVGGQVTLEGNPHPSGTRVMLHGENGFVVQETYPDGQFYTVAPAGDYEISFSKPGYLTEVRREPVQNIVTHQPLNLSVYLRAGEINGDGVIDLVDLVAVARSMGRKGFPAEDLNGDAVVNMPDYVLAANNYGLHGPARPAEPNQPEEPLEPQTPN